MASQRNRRTGRTASAGFAVFAIVGLLSAGGAVAPGPLTRPAQAAPTWLDRVNTYRAQVGAPPLTESASLSANAAKHAAYMAATNTVTHYEDPANPYYSAEGDLAARNSNLSAGAADPIFAVDGWMAAPFHALMMLRPELSQTGYAQNGLNHVLDVDSIREHPTPGTGWPRVWPSGAHAATLTIFGGREIPNPLVACQRVPTERRPYGLPLLVSFGPGAAITSASANLAKDGFPVAVCVTSAASYTDPSAQSALSQHNTVLVIPHAPLEYAARYTGTVTTNLGSAVIDFTVGRGTPLVEFQVLNDNPVSSRRLLVGATALGGYTADGTFRHASTPIAVQWRKAGTPGDSGWATAASLPSRFGSQDVQLPTAADGPLQMRAVFDGDARLLPGVSTVVPVTVAVPVRRSGPGPALRTRVTGWPSGTTTVRVGTLVTAQPTVHPRTQRYVSLQHRRCSSCKWHTRPPKLTTARGRVTVRVRAVEQPRRYRLVVSPTKRASTAKTLVWTVRGR